MTTASHFHLMGTPKAVSAHNGNAGAYVLVSSDSFNTITLSDETPADLIATLTRIIDAVRALDTAEVAA